jgi:hypothetical protein
MQLTKLDVLAALIAAATGLAFAEDRSRTEIVTSAPAIEAMAAETCAQAEARAARVGDPDGGNAGRRLAGAGETRALRRRDAGQAGAPLPDVCAGPDALIGSNGVKRPRYSAASLGSVWRSVRSVMRADLPRRSRR